MRLAAAFAALAVALGALWLWLIWPEASWPRLPWTAVREAAEAHAAPGLRPLTARKAALEGHRLAPALLLGVYDAFSRATEAEVYDTLAEVAAGDALEALYLERMGALAGGGLAAADQTVHEIRLLDLATAREGDRLLMEARWQVIGTVGHDAHRHRRGNAYAADLAVEPVDGAWRLTGFRLREVDRTLAGTDAGSHPP